MKSIIPAVFVCCSVLLGWEIREIDLPGVYEIVNLEFCNGIVYACVEYDEYSRCNGIIAIDIETGEELWFHKTGSEDNVDRNVPYEIRYWNGRIYSTVSHLGILCLEASSGADEFLWEYSGYLHAPFVLKNGYLFAATPSELIKLDADAGQTEWVLTLESEDGETPLTLSDLSMDHGKLLVGSIQTPMFCASPSTGEILWRNEDIQGWRDDSYSGTRYISEHLVFATVDAGDMAVLNAVDGSLAAFYDNCRYLGSDDGGIYLVLLENDERHLCALDPGSGEISLRVVLDQDISSIATTGDILCTGSSDGQFLVLRRSELTDEAERIYGRRISTENISVTVYGDRIFAISEDGIIFSVNSRLEDELEIESGYEFTGPALFSEGRCVLPAQNSLLVLDY
jgi:outer membrane protein assembly factor BamB